MRGAWAGPGRVAFTRREVREFSGWSRTRLHIHLSELVDMEYVALDSGKVNSVQHYRLLYSGEGRNGGKFMLGLRPVAEVAAAAVPPSTAAPAKSPPLSGFSSL